MRRVDTSGIITTVAGGRGGLGDGGPATEAGLYYPEGVAIDSFGNLYIADSGNERVREVEGIFMPPAIAEITGGVTDSSTGSPLPDAVVIIKDALNASYSSRTGSDGRYVVLVLNQGTFTATFSKSGYFEQTVNGTVNTGQTQTLDIQLTQAPALNVTITSPKDGVTVNSSPVTVTGSVSHSAAITVNGVQASVSNNTFSSSTPLSEGSNPIQVIATDQYGQTASQTIHVVLALATGGTLAGTVTDSSTGLPLPSVTVSVTDSQNLTQIALTDNNGGFSISGIPPGPFNGSITKGGYTSRTFSGTMVSGQPVTINAALTPILPLISNIAASGITTTSATITWATDQLTDSFVDYGTTTSYGNWVRDLTLATSHTIILNSLTPATTYHFKVTSKNGYGFSSSSGDSSFTTLTPNPITLVITAPLNNDTISRSDTLVKGTVTNSTGNETGVVVNGFIANVYGNEFVVNHMPLAVGSNTITATATDTSGNTQTASVTVNSVSAGDYIKITPSEESGLSPLEVTLTIDSSLDLKNAQLTYAGPGQVEYPFTSPGEYNLRMTTEGVYYFNEKVSDPNGKTYDDTVAVTVPSRTEIDNLLRAKWERMKAGLSNKDIDNGLDSFLESSREDYQEIFNLIIDSLPQIVSDMQDIQMIYLRNNVAKYRINRLQDINGSPQTITYYIYFVRDQDGLWKIDRF